MTIRLQAHLCEVLILRNLHCEAVKPSAPHYLNFSGVFSSG